MSSQHEKLYLEDLFVGQTFESPSIVVTKEVLLKFATEFDPQPFHLDDEAAKDTLFGGLACSGWHTAAITMKLLVSSMPLAGGIIGMGGEITWPRPTRPEDQLHLVSTILSITPSRSKPDRGIVSVKSETFNQHNQVVQTFVANIVVFTRAVN